MKPLPTLGALLILLAYARPGAAAAPPPDPKFPPDRVGPFLAAPGGGGQGGERPKRDFRVDRLSGDFVDKAARERWIAVLEPLKDGTMPPESKPRPPAKDMKAAVEWIAG